MVLHDNGRSYKAQIDGVVTPVWLPKAEVTFYDEGPNEQGRPQGTFEIPKWLAKKEGLA